MTFLLFLNAFKKLFISLPKSNEVKDLNLSYL